MSKSRHKYRVEEDYGEGVTPKKPSQNRIKEKRIDRALRTKNIDELMELDDDFNDDDPYQGYYGNDADL